MTKLAPQEAAITDWLAAQKEAMLALLAEVVNIDSGSYDKAGVDAVGARFVRFFEEHGLLTEPRAPRALRRCHPRPPRRQAAQRAPDRADGPSRHRVPQGRGGAPAVPHRGRPRLRPRRGRHEGRARRSTPSCWRPSSASAARRRRSPASSPATRRSPRPPRGRSSSGWRARRAACSTPSPAGPAATSSPARKGGVFLRLEVTARPRTRAATSRRASAPSASWRTRSSPCTS